MPTKPNKELINLVLEILDDVDSWQLPVDWIERACATLKKHDVDHERCWGCNNGKS